MAYERFTKCRGRHQHPAPRIWCGMNSLSLNKTAVDLIDLSGESTLVALWIDRISNRVGMSLQKDELSYCITRRKSQASMSCKGFLHSTGLSGAGTIHADWDPETKILSWAIPERVEK